MRRTILLVDDEFKGMMKLLMLYFETLKLFLL